MQFVRGGPDVPDRLLQAHEDGRVVVFCGAGISRPAGLPDFKELVKQIHCRLGSDQDPAQAAIGAKQYDKALGWLESNIVDGRRTVRQEIARILDPDVSDPKATHTHKALLTLAKCRDQRTRLVTTNFDRLFEHAIIDNNDPSVKRFEAPALPVPKQRWDGLVYLHGLLPENANQSSLDNLVVSSGDFGLAYLTERWAARFVSELVRNFTLCFVGYSIDDPILRYMMDALAADRLLGETPNEMFAFGSCSKGKENACAEEWRAKNVTPILYREHKRHGHAYLHKTLGTWADRYRDGVLGKEHIVNEYAALDPETSTTEDNFVSRMLWSLSDPSGLPAKRFADMKPAPRLTWLAKFEKRFDRDDLVRFGIPSKVVKADEEMRFSLMRRPAPYNLSATMALVHWVQNEGGFDKVMRQLSRWLTCHLNNPTLLLWAAKQGGWLNAEFAKDISERMDELSKLEHEGNTEELNRIRKEEPDGTPGKRMRALWSLVLADRVEKVGMFQDEPYHWRKRFEREGLTAALRLKLRDMLSPRIRLSEKWQESSQWQSDENDNCQKPKQVSEIVDWKIVLSASNVRDAFDGIEKNKNWNAVLPILLDNLTHLLRDMLDIKAELGEADAKQDWSFVDQPSISDHPQNSGVQDWTFLIELARDACLATAEQSPERARLAAEGWSQIPYPLFRRLAFFAAAQPDIVPCRKGLEWLLADDNQWLWSAETKRETMRLLFALGPSLDRHSLTTLERTILSGQPLEMFRKDIDATERARSQERAVWVRLAKLNQAGTTLSLDARNRLCDLSRKHPDWRLADNEREEFAFWQSKSGELLTGVKTPRDQDELIQWLRKSLNSDRRRPDDWYERCRDDFSTASSALKALAEDGYWPADRWNEALNQWSKDELLNCSWNEIAPVLIDMPNENMPGIQYGMSWWLERLSGNFKEHETAFLCFCDRILALDYNVKDAEEDPVAHAINHPVGRVTRALLRWGFRNDLANLQGLNDKIKSRFTRLCNTEDPKFRHGRVLLAMHVISLFTSDPEWASEHLLPLFDWNNSEKEARSAWEGFLSSPRINSLLFEELKPPFLDTANHCSCLGRGLGNYALLLVTCGLDPGYRDSLGKNKLKMVMLRLPSEALNDAAQAFFRAVDSAAAQSADYWRNRASPFLESIWPKSLNTVSPQVRENFCRACIAAGDAFPEALQEVLPWLNEPLPDPILIVHFLHERLPNNLSLKLAESAIELLDRIIGQSTQGRVHGLKDCLKSIKSAQPELENCPRFKRLWAIAR